MNDDGTLHWDHFADALKKYDPHVDRVSKRGFFTEMAGAKVYEAKWRSLHKPKHLSRQSWNSLGGFGHEEIIMDTTS